MAKKERKFPFGSNFINKKNAEYWGERSGSDYKVVKRKSGYTVKRK